MRVPWSDSIRLRKFSYRTRKHICKYKVPWTSIVAIFLIIGFWTPLFDGLLSYTQMAFVQIPNPHDTNEKLYMAVRLISPTFAANSPINVDVAIYMNYTYRQANHLDDSVNEPDSFFVLFYGSQCGIPPDHLGACIGVIPRVHPNSYHNNFNPISYPHGGSFDIGLTTDLGSLENRTKTDSEFIHISPTEAANEFRTFKMSIIIGIIAGAIGLIALFIQYDSLPSKR